MPDKNKSADQSEKTQGDKNADQLKTYLDEQREGIQLLRKKYTKLHTSDEVESAAKRTGNKTGVKVSQKPDEKIANYLNRFREILDREDEAERQRGIEALRKILHHQYVIKPEDIPQSYWNKQAEIIISQGRKAELLDGDVEERKYTDKSGNEKTDYIFPEELKNQNTEVLIADQKSTMDNWINYLTSHDADSSYPDWARYWAFRSMLGLSTYDKEKEIFAKRTKDTVAPFPDLDREALAYTIDLAKKKAERTPIYASGTYDEQKAFIEVLASDDFGKLYAHAIENITPTETSELEKTAGQWIKYDQGSDHMPLVTSLQGHGTGWCTAGESTAEIQLQGGDFYVYYSYDNDSKPTIPRIAIRMENDSIGEVRGIAHEQNLDPYIAPVLDEKLKEFGSEGEAYQKKSADMKRLTVIVEKKKEGKDLTRDEIMFIYEADNTIEGFGYERDPRIDEVKEGRNIKEDANAIDEISLLEKRFNNSPEHYKRLEGINIAKVKASLEANPEAKLSLALMKLTGGRPDIIEETDTEYIFADCSAESPNRRNLNYDQSAEMAEKFGIEMMPEDIYRKIQETGRFDLNTWSWLKTPDDIRVSGRALDGGRYSRGVRVFRSSAEVHDPDHGWRGLLRVQKV